MRAIRGRKGQCGWLVTSVFPCATRRASQNPSPACRLSVCNNPVSQAFTTPRITCLPQKSPRMIEVKDLRKEFGTKVAVDGVTFTVQKGEVLGFLGPNGAGKS